MPELVFETRAIKVANKGKSIIHAKVEKHRRKVVKVDGNDYLVFKCPKCGSRNKRCITTASYMKKKTNLITNEKEPVYAFTCNGFACFSTVEVSPPYVPNLIKP